MPQDARKARGGKGGERRRRVFGCKLFHELTRKIVPVE